MLSSATGFQALGRYESVQSTAVDSVYPPTFYEFPPPTKLRGASLPNCTTVKTVLNHARLLGKY